MKIKHLGKLPDESEKARRAARALHDTPKTGATQRIRVGDQLSILLQEERQERTRAEVLADLKRYRSRW